MNQFEIEAKLHSMARLQDETNSRLNPDWRKAGHDYRLAAVVELGELADHLGYKWWSEKQPDLAQAKMEIVDVFHFLLSDVLQSSSAAVDSALSSAATALARTDRVSKNWKQDLKSVINEISDPYTSERESFGRAVYCLVPLMNYLEFDFAELYTQYIGKAALNRFRWENGYGTTYVKIWDGREDNEHLSAILKQIPFEDLSVYAVEARLKIRYKELVVDRQ